MKRLLIVLLMSCLFVNSNFCKEEKIILESPLLSLIDGKTFGVSAVSFGLMLKQRLELRRRIYGVMQENGKRIGFFEFEGKKVTLLDLCEIESHVGEDSVKKDALRKLLDSAKDDFMAISDKYAQAIRSIKEPLLGLLEEFVEKKGLKHCFLITWGSITAQEEEDAIRSELKDFKDFTKFYIELADFLEVLANSCPKGKRLFVEMVKKARAGK